MNKAKKSIFVKKSRNANSVAEPSLAEPSVAEPSVAEHFVAEPTVSAPQCTKAVEIRGKTTIRRIGGGDKTSVPQAKENSSGEKKKTSIRVGNTVPQDSECISILDQLNTEKSLSTREDVIHELEIKKKTLNEKMRAGGGNATAKELEGVRKLLKEIRSAELNDKYQNVEDDLKVKIVDWFRKNKKQLDMDVFTSTINLTAPKTERTADPNDEIFVASKSYFSKHKDYEKCTEDTEKKNLKKIKKNKKIPEEFLQQIDQNVKRNLSKREAILSRDEAIIGYRKYDPFVHVGLPY